MILPTESDLQVTKSLTGSAWPVISCGTTAFPISFFVTIFDKILAAPVVDFSSTWVYSVVYLSTFIFKQFCLQFVAQLRRIKLSTIRLSMGQATMDKQCIELAISLHLDF